MTCPRARSQAAWTRKDSFYIIKVMAERQCRTLRRLYTDDNPEPFQIGVHYHTRRLPTRQKSAVGMKAVVNRLRLELLSVTDATVAIRIATAVIIGATTAASRVLFPR